MPSRPDLERVVIDHLIAASVAGGRVHGSLGDTPTFPAVTVKRVGGPREWPGRIDRARIQIDCWGTTKEDAWDTVEAATTAIDTLPGIHTGGGVTHVTETLGPTWLEDPETQRPRYVFEVSVTGHPTP